MKTKVTIQTLLRSPSALQLESPLEAELLLAHVLEVSRVYLYTWPERALNEQQQRQFLELTERRLDGEPIAYLLGSKEFWSLPLTVTKEVLIPRPETELLVQTVLDHCPKDLSTVQILELGTGSGAIALALATDCKNAKITALDNSEASLAIARQNAKNLKLETIDFIYSDWFSVFDSESDNENPDKPLFDIIVSNPPYLAPNDIHLQTDLRYEPQGALVSKPDGFGDLKQIILQAPRYLKLKGWLMLEHGFQQAEEVRQCMDYNGYVDIQVIKDLAGLDRVTIGSLKRK